MGGDLFGAAGGGPAVVVPAAVDGADLVIAGLGVEQDALGFFAGWVHGRFSFPAFLYIRANLFIDSPGRFGYNRG